MPWPTRGCCVTGGKKIIRTHYIDVSKNVRVRGCLSRPEGVREQISLGNSDSLTTLGFTESFTCSQRKTFRGVRSGERGGNAVGLPLPIHRPGNSAFVVYTIHSVQATDRCAALNKLQTNNWLLVWFISSFYDLPKL